MREAWYIRVSAWAWAKTLSKILSTTKAATKAILRTNSSATTIFHHDIRAIAWNLKGETLAISKIHNLQTVKTKSRFKER